MIQRLAIARDMVVSEDSAWDPEAQSPTPTPAELSATVREAQAAATSASFRSSSSPLAALGQRGRW